MTVAWVDDLRAALDVEFGDAPRVATLATVDSVGHPRARTVICRKVEDDGSLRIASDSRSEKNAQIRGHPFAEMVFWLATSRRQYRVAGPIEVVRGDDPRRVGAWSALTDAARALFFWPPPGLTRRRGDDFPERAAPEGEIPASFEVLSMRPDRVEQLDLTERRHRRLRWSGAGWVEINP